MSECKHGAVVWGDCVKCKDKRIANLEAIKERLENLLAEGVHTCSQTCKRPLCVLRREKADLEQQLVRQEAYYMGDRKRIADLEQKCEKYHAGKVEMKIKIADLVQELADANARVQALEMKVNGRNPDGVLIPAEPFHQ